MDNQLAILEKDKERLIEELRSADREVLEADLTREVRTTVIAFASAHFST